MRKRRSISEINVVPYIDVMLVLLVIFMATAPLLTQGVVVELPQAPSEAIEDTDDDPGDDRPRLAVMELQVEHRGAG